jgi:hypothetical protein
VKLLIMQFSSSYLFLLTSIIYPRHCGSSEYKISAVGDTGKQLFVLAQWLRFSIVQNVIDINGEYIATSRNDLYKLISQCVNASGRQNFHFVQS